MTRRTAMRTATATAFVVIFAQSLLPTTALLGCPFCSAVTNTFSEDIANMDAVIIARLAKPVEPAAGAGKALNITQSTRATMATFNIDEVLKGKQMLGDAKSISTVYFGDAKLGDTFLVMASDPKNLTWSPPLPLNQRQREYLTKLVELPKEGPQRLAYFQQYLQDSDPTLAQDAYDEFARAPYEHLKQLKDHMDHDQLVKWINDPTVPASQQRLYLTMLGVCGGKEDLEMIEKRLRSDDPQSKAGLDALIACYITLRGMDGVSVVEDLFLKKRDDNFSGEYADVYAAIMALRFHGTQGGVIPRSRVLKSFHYVLDNPQMADLIIPDLARWEDWSQLDRLVELFKKGDTEAVYVRVPVINYMRACPLPEAKEALAEFKKIDPEAVKRAMTFFQALPGKNG